MHPKESDLHTYPAEAVQAMRFYRDWAYEQENLSESARARA